MVHIEIHQEPVLRHSDGELGLSWLMGIRPHERTMTKEEALDVWSIYLCNGDKRFFIEKFDGFPIFSQRADKRNQYEMALSQAVELCDIIGINPNTIKKVPVKETPHYSKALEEIKREKQHKIDDLKRQLAILTK